MKSSDKEIDEILEWHFFLSFNLYDNELEHKALCSVFKNTKYEEEWEEFWARINTGKRATVPHYFKKYDYTSGFECALLRLLIVEEFKASLK